MITNINELFRNLRKLIILLIIEILQSEELNISDLFSNKSFRNKTHSNDDEASATSETSNVKLLSNEKVDTIT